MRTIRDASRIFGGNMYRSIDIAASGMSVQRRKMDAIASNIANATTTNVDGQGNPYLRRQVLIRPGERRTFERTLTEAGLRLKNTRYGHVRGGPSRRETTYANVVGSEEIEMPNTGKNTIYEPAHPDADAEGKVTYPDVDIVVEMVEMMVANRIFDANVTVVNAGKSMIMRSLEI